MTQSPSAPQVESRPSPFLDFHRKLTTQNAAPKAHSAAMTQFPASIGLRTPWITLTTASRESNTAMMIAPRRARPGLEGDVSGCMG